MLLDFLASLVLLLLSFFGTSYRFFPKGFSHCKSIKAVSNIQPMMSIHNNAGISYNKWCWMMLNWFLFYFYVVVNFHVQFYPWLIKKWNCVWHYFGLLFIIEQWLWIAFSSSLDTYSYGKNKKYFCQYKSNI